MIFIKDYYNSLAKNYESLIESPKTGATIIHFTIKDIFKTLEIKKGKILDVGCGPGNLKKYLGDKFSYTGIDFSKEMLKEAKQKGYKTLEGEIEDILPTIKDKSFDYVLAVSSLHFVKNINFTIKEFERISRNGFCITLDRITDKYKKGFKTVADGNVYNHYNLKIKNTLFDKSIMGWISPRGNEKIKVRIVYKNLKIL